MTIAGLEPIAPGRLRLGSVAMLYLVRLRRRWVAELTAALGVAAGVALIYAAAVAATSPSAPVVRALNDGVVGNSQLQLLARGGTRMPERLYTRVAALPGVVRVAPILQVPANVVGRRGQQDLPFFAADPRLVELRGNGVAGFNSTDAANQEALILPEPVARSIGVRFGDDALVRIAGRALTLPIIAAGREQIGTLVDADLGLMPLRYLQRLARTGPQVSRMLVEARPGRVAEVRAALARIAGPSADVLGADHESRMFSAAVRPVNRATVTFAVPAALVGWLLALSAVLVTVGHRRRMAAQQRLQGVGPPVRLATLLVDATAVGISGTLLGLAAGEALSQAWFSSDASFLAGVFPVGMRRVVTWECVAGAAVGGLLAAAAGVLAPTRRVRPLFAFGLPCLIGAVVLVLLAPGAVLASSVLLALALVLLLPPALATGVRAFEAAHHRLGRPSNAMELAVQLLHDRRWRTCALAVALTAAVAVFGATALRGAEAGAQAGLDRMTALTAPDGVWAALPGTGSVQGTSPVAPSAAAAIARQPGIAGVTPYHSGLLDIAGRRAWVLGQPDGVDPVLAEAVVDGDADAVAARLRHGGWATLSTDVADALGLGVGDAFTLPSPQPLRLRVAATTSDLGWTSGAIVLGAADHRRAWDGDAITAYRVRAAARVAPEEAARQVKAALGPDTPLRVETGAARADRQRTAARAALARPRQVALLTLLAGVLAIAAIVGGLLWQHRPYVSHLKSHGPTTALMWRVLLIETTVLIGAGAALGVLLGLMGQVLAARGLQTMTGFPVLVALRPGVAVTTVAAVGVAALAAAAVAGFLVARARPAWRS